MRHRNFVLEQFRKKLNLLNLQIQARATENKGYILTTPEEKLIVETMREKIKLLWRDLA